MIDLFSKYLDIRIHGNMKNVDVFEPVAMKNVLQFWRGIVAVSEQTISSI